MDQLQWQKRERVPSDFPAANDIRVQQQSVTEAVRQLTIHLKPVKWQENKTSYKPVDSATLQTDVNILVVWIYSF